MALVINTTPGSYYSANGDLLFVVYESVKANDPATYPDYKYVADVYVGATKVATIKKYPLPDSKRGVFNIGQIVRSYITATFNPAAGSLVAQTLASGSFYIDVTVKFGEEYDFTLYTNVTVDSARRYFGHYNGMLLTGGTILPDYQNRPSTNRAPVTQVSQSDTFVFLPYTGTSGSSVTVNFGNDSGGAFSSNFSPVSENMQVLNVSPSVINALSAGFINDYTRYYTVTIAGIVYRFDVACDPRFDAYNLHFLNKLGGFDTVQFNKASKKTVPVTRSDFGKLPYTITGSGGVEYVTSAGVMNEERSVYASLFTERLTLNSDFLSDQEYAWLAELVISPLVYLQRGSYFIPVTLAATNYEYRKRQTDGLTNLSIDLEMGKQFNAQFR